MKSSENLQISAVAENSTSQAAAPDTSSPGEASEAIVAETSQEATEAIVATEAIEATPEDDDDPIQAAYLRGRNEAIEELMRRPGAMQPIDLAPSISDCSEVMILSSSRPGIWDID